jgi:hypothetical protein
VGIEGSADSSPSEDILISTGKVEFAHESCDGEFETRGMSNWSDTMLALPKLGCHVAFPSALAESLEYKRILMTPC